MSQAITLETSNTGIWQRLQSTNIDGVLISRVIRLSEDTKLKLVIFFASNVAISLFSSALYDVLISFNSHDTTINSKQVPGNQVQIGVLINSQVLIKQSNPEADCKQNHDKKHYN